ncbi:MFS transporter [Bradyrhizobium sp. 183]|uniref:MFS transporter n=1 Tax=unclassified Bradyrhizobium TaxID=2631580 RepID=UPI001FFFE6A1|nr:MULTISPECIES: MFS transporter [unclassified Bradyrhizobium]UPJ79255.1 MFS transporter [Bradyrhizobium sp. 184]UPJ87048.1 MFS transporter [Bradyrhizobium sp. 183]
MSRAAGVDGDAVSPSTFSPLRNPTFRSIWLASQVSSLGWMMHTVAIAWLMATISTSHLTVALVQASTALPPFILSVLVGAIADNFSRRMVILIGRTIIILASAILTALMALGLVDPWVILGISFLIGCGVALSDPAWQASVGDLVERHDIPAAVTLINIGINTIRSVGPAFGGIIVASFGPLITLALSTLSYLVPTITIWRSKWRVRSSPLPREAITTAIYDGARFTAISSEIKAAITRGALFGLSGTAILALLPLVVRDQLKGGAFAYGVLMGGFGLGGLFGGVAASRLRQLLSQEWLVRLGCLACAACALALALAPSVPIATAALALGGVGWVTVWSGLGVSVQLASPRWVVGRTVSIYYALRYGGIAAGSWVWGWVADNYSLTLALEESALALVLAAAAGLLFPIIDDHEADHDPWEGFEAPSVALNLKPRSGPIVVKIEYEIPAKSTEAFLILMQERRRAQSRIGARHWTIERDLQRPREWTETFRAPTWADYLRLNHRLTGADNELEKRLWELHAGKQPPQKRLSIERPTGHSRKAEHTPFIARV